MEAKRGYDKLKSGYEKIPISFFNKYIEIPAVKKVIGNIRGKKVLDVGCATGTHSMMLKGRGAIVSGIDISSEMVDITKKKMPSSDFRVADMKKIPFKAKSFDVLFYGLCIHYEKNLNIVFKEANRVLKKGGRIIISTHNPCCTGQKKIKVAGKYLRVVDDYFSDRKNKMELSGVELTIYPKTISGLLNPIIRNGFRLLNILEPQPSKGSRKFDKESYYQTIKRPSFIVIDAQKL